MKTDETRKNAPKTVLRTATAADAERMGALHLASWRATYTRELSAAYLERQDPDQWTARWQRHLANGVAVVLAEHDDALMGFVSCGPEQTDVDSTTTWEIYNIHVAPGSHTRGIGRQLFDAAATLGRERGATRLVLWVVTTNANARAFYAHIGMRADGREQTHALGDESLDEVRYAIDL